MREQTTFDLISDPFIKLDNNNYLPIGWNTQAIEKSINSELYKHLLDAPVKKPDNNEKMPYSQLLDESHMNAVATQLAGYPDTSDNPMSIEASIIPLYVMSRFKEGGNPLYSLIITQRIGELLDQNTNSTTISTNAYTRGCIHLQHLSENDLLTPLAQERLKDIHEAITSIIGLSTQDRSSNNNQDQNIERYPELIRYFEDPQNYLREKKFNKKYQALAAELISGNAPIALWEKLFTFGSFKTAVKNGLCSSETTFTVKPHPQYKELITLFNEHSKKLLQQYLPELFARLMETRETEDLQSIIQLPIHEEQLLASDKNKLNIVQQAAKYNIPEVIKALHEKGIPVETLLNFNIRKYRDTSAIMWAVKKNHPAIIQAFSEIGATAKQLEPESCYPDHEHPTMRALTPKNTLTTTAAEHNHHEALKALIDAGLTKKQLLHSNRKGEMPHYIAAEKGHHEIIELLGNKLSLKTLLHYKELTPKPRNLLEVAIAGGEHDDGNHSNVSNVIKALHRLDTEKKWINNHKACKGLSPLNYSIKHKKFEAVSTLVDLLSIDEILTPCPQGLLPSHYAVQLNADEGNLFDALKEKGINMYALMAPNKRGETPLHIAAKNKNSQIIDKLRGLGTPRMSLTTRSKTQLTPIHLAVIERSLPTLNALLEFRPCLNQINMKVPLSHSVRNRTALKIAQKNGDLAIINALEKAIENCQPRGILL